MQIELVVEDYLNPVLSHCAQWNIRSAIGLAFVVACSVRGGPESKLVRLLSQVGTAKLQLVDKFESSRQERECVQAIANASSSSVSTGQKQTIQLHVCDVDIDADEKRRAALLLKDEYHFLKEDLYETSTYGATSDV